MQYKEIKKTIDHKLSEFAANKTIKLDGFKREIDELLNASKDTTNEKLKLLVQQEVGKLKQQSNVLKKSKPTVDVSEIVEAVYTDTKKEYTSLITQLQQMNIGKDSISATTATMLKDIVAYLQQSDEKINKEWVKISKNLKKDYKNIFDLQPVENLFRLSLLKDVYTKASLSIVQPSGTVPTNSSYPYTTQREQAAKSCAIVAGRLLKDIDVRKWDWDECEILPIELCDAATHYNLAIALLNGNKKEIDNAYSMDTACRDFMTTTTHTFINEKVFSSTYPNPAVAKKPMKLK